ncbi:hypothetical protein [Oceaniovalibus sp. ACAM 378]|uniref:hypothetical protein n=1 Tax=Oceaniovalibus sp. ACAM 378 TaxID=2599923 RepID=UPI0011D72958|nr:hypothetical protein [Oceaniovalibus sp. ACAM 378]TYB83685.1 hypothetical protein FQ320_24335 [Oceaniovalibus sp. ACAM 378]
MKILLAAGAVVSSAGMAAAGCGGIGGGVCVNVPEISALDGVAAIAVVLTAVALVWERKRRV